MVKFKRRLSIKQYIEYVLNLIPYTGKRANTDVSKMTQMVLDVAHDYLYLGHHSFMDNYYMSIELVASLLGHCEF